MSEPPRPLVAREPRPTEIPTTSNTAYMEIHSLFLTRAVSEPPRPLVAREPRPTEILTISNAAYMEISIATEQQEPSEPIYEPVADVSLCRRAKKGVLPNHHPPLNVAPPTALPPRAPSTRAQSLPKGGTYKTTPVKALPNESLQARRRPPMPLPLDNEDNVYERLNTTHFVDINPL